MKSTTKKFIGYIVSLFFLSALCAIYVVQITDVYGNSMEPELRDKQKVFVNKLIYEFEEPERFDIIVFRYLYKTEEYYIKRIIGLPGETVQIKDGVVYVNGEALADPYAYETVKDAGRAAEPILLGEGEYFVLGDNRNHSSDSRGYDVANVKRPQILGRVFAKMWPFAGIR